MILEMDIDITERKRAERELQEKSAELERFTYAISHDLKSPLVTVKTFLGYLEQDLLSSDTGRIEKDMFYMRTAADKMRQLLDELLEVLRIGRIANPPVRVTFRELVEETLNVVAGPIAGREVKVQVNDAPITLYGDRPRLVEIWQNLVENAVKFMGDQPSPRIEIGAERRGGDTVFFVRDNGIGIDPRHQAKVFDLFEKIGAESEGVGLGLALIKRIVELYRGTIWLESKGLGQGVCFLFTLPGAVKNQEEGEES
jgi:signal transduction histidine kinase